MVFCLEDAYFLFIYVLSYEYTPKSFGAAAISPLDFSKLI